MNNHPASKTIRLRERSAESALFAVTIWSGESASAADASVLCEDARTRGPGLTVIRVPGEAIKAVHVIENAGGSLCDVLIRLARSIPRGGLAVESSLQYHVRRADKNDVREMEGLGRAAFRSFQGHWHSDPRLPKDLCDELYARWSRDLTKSASDASPVLVACDADDSEIVGFLALESPSSGVWNVPLTGVHPKARGQGLLRRMILEATQMIATGDETRFEYETQISNVAALRVVANCGFVPVSSRLTFHLWHPAPKLDAELAGILA